MRCLSEILQEYENWDNTKGTDKNITHSYGSIYKTIFDPIRLKIQSLLEIGIASGASLLVFAEFFQNATIFGIDITLNQVIFGTNNPRIFMYKLDATLPSTPNCINKMYDVIIDDGSHEMEDQLESLRIFIPYLNRGGTYIIEDIDEKHENRIKSSFKNISDSHNLKMQWIDLRSIKHRYDDIIAVFQRV